jgi:inorganic pyrophosphatase
MFQHFRPHPWHGLPVRPAKPELVYAYIEITPFDPVKYEVDKESGYLKVDRPQQTNSLPPTLYGFVPRTYCGEQIAALAGVQKGDGDPLDICVISERPIAQKDIILSARILGGLLMVDNQEADDKLVAVLDRDPLWGGARELEELPQALVDRLCHYFLTYKLGPDASQPVQITKVYGREHAEKVLKCAEGDYQAKFGAGS